MKVTESYFKELKEQILDSSKWINDKFVVFNHEAGTGKSRNTHRIIGEMTKNQKHWVLYVQRFSKENELDHTVAAINRHAGRKVAISFTGEDTKKVKSKEVIVEHQIICITHQMYIQICKGEHQYLIRDRDMLIIDEYPDLLEKISISSADIGRIWAECNKWRIPEMGGLALVLRNLKDAESSRHILSYIDFPNDQYKQYVQAVKSAIKKLSDKNAKAYKGILQKCLHLLTNGGFLFEDGFHTFDGSHQFVLLKNNIILDANAAFDSRYKLCDKFVIHEQEKVYDYKKDTLHHFQIKTTKRSLKERDDFFQLALKEVRFEGKRGILFVTDKESVEKLKQEIVKLYKDNGNSIEEIEKRLDCNLGLDYFGNLIGVNRYREYDAVVMLKTPNYDYLAYALTYLYFRKMYNKPIESVEMFKDEVVETIRRNIVGGEYYQTAKRVNRDNSQCADIYVFTDYQDAVDILIEQLPGIRYIQKHLFEEKESDKRGYDNTKRMQLSKKAKAKEVLLEAKKSGRQSMRKKELRERLELSDDGSRISRILNDLEAESFLKEHGIRHHGQQIWFVDNSCESDLNESA